MAALVRHLTAHAVLVGACAAIGVAGCSGSRPSARGFPGTAGGAAATPRTLRSNVERADYAGSGACVPCHAEVAAAWEHSPMHRMTRDAHGAEVHAPFDGATWRFKDDTVVLETRGDDRFVRVAPASGNAKSYRVTRIIGGRTREDFAGVEVGGRDEERVLPVSFVFATGALRYKGYSVMVHERSTVRAGPVWSRTCIFCHNTVPEMDRFLGALAGTGRARAPAYQGEQVDRWLPDPRRAAMRVTDAPAFAVAANGEIARLGGVATRANDDAESIARHAIDVVRAGFDGAALIELGIGCEACHGGAIEHTRNPAVHPSFVPTAPWLDLTPAPSPSPVLAVAATPPHTPASAFAINRVCARCHQVLFSRYPFTWEGGRRDATAGGSHINSGEGRDFLLGGCASAMACTTCHDPHGGAQDQKLQALATPEGNPLCTGCHSAFADRARAREHTHHDPGGAGGSCVACHMPRKNMGLGGTLTRYHRIGSPTDPARVLGDRPLECALCHAGKTVGSLVDTMESWWPVRYPRQRLEELYGSLGANVMRATLERGKPHERAVAIATLGEVRDRAAVPLVAKELLGEYPLVREWSKRALVSITGRCDVDLAADDATIARGAATCGAALPVSSAAPSPSLPEHDEDPED